MLNSIQNKNDTDGLGKMEEVQSQVTVKRLREKSGK